MTDPDGFLKSHIASRFASGTTHLPNAKNARRLTETDEAKEQRDRQSVFKKGVYFANLKISSSGATLDARRAGRQVL